MQKSRNNERIERNNDINDINLFNTKKDRHGRLIKSQELKQIDDNNNNNISVIIENNKKEENEEEENEKEDNKIENNKIIIEDDKEEEDKIENKIENKVKNDKLELGEDNKEDNKEKDIKKRCCLRSKNNQGCCICLGKKNKCSSCLYFDYYMNNLKKREPIELEPPPKAQKYPIYSLFPNDPYQDIELRSFHSIERENSQIIPIAHRSLANTNESSLENGQIRELNTPFWKMEETIKKEAN